MNRERLATLVVLKLGALAAIAACTSDEPTVTSPAGPDGGGSAEGGISTPTGASGVQQLADAYCRFAERCREQLFRTSFASLDACVASYRTTLAATAARPGAKPVDAQMAACAAKAKTSTCDVALNKAAECIYRGEAALGVGCRQTAQCASGSCTRTDAGGVCGVCTEELDVGGDCFKGGCKLGLAFQYSVDGKTCTCVVPQAEGAPCSGQTCEGTLVCVAGVCKRYLQLGASCVEGAGDLCDFDRDLRCTAGSCAPRVRAKLGQPCDTATRCEASSCVNGSCVAYAGVGSACGSPTVPYCAFELDCELDAVDGGATCVAEDPDACSK